MFDFVQQELRRRKNTNIEPAPQVDDTDLVLECAHVFQELDDLSMSGSDDSRNRFGSNGVVTHIPLEDDIEIESIEMNICDGRITDVPMDATVQESNYLGMKTFEDFYQEAVTEVVQFVRESSEAVHARRLDYAQKKFNQYRDYIIQEGLFGFDKISIEDRRVPYHILADFGPMHGNNGQHYIVKLKLLYETDNKHRILKKQLDSLNYMQAFDMFTEFGKQLPGIMKKLYPDNMEKVDNVWDVCTPIQGLIPMDPPDEYRMLIRLEVDFLDEPINIGMSGKIKPNKSSNSGIKESSSGVHKIDVEKINNVNLNNFASKKEIMQECAVMRKPSRFGNVFQEAIDFGAPPEPSNQQTQQQPGVQQQPAEVSNAQPQGQQQAIDGGAPMDMGGMNIDPTSVSQNDLSIAPDGGDKTAVPVDSNNVSDQIVEKVSSELNQDGDDAGSDFDTSTDMSLTDDGSTDLDMSTSVDDISGDTTNDITTDDASDMTNSVDQQLSDLDNSGKTDMDFEPSESIDVENMTIDELLAQGSERLKGMTIQQLKDFLSTADSSAIQEAFFLTPKNINHEIEVHLRAALGILNDNEKELPQIISDFKKTGKKLNKALSKASKMKKVYSESEREDINKLNKCLVDLIMTLKSSQDSSYIATVKRLIQAFTSLSKVVEKIVEGKSGNKTVQESGLPENKKVGE